nr:talin-1-like isoform X2 [Vanessa tameamea]
MAPISLKIVLDDGAVTRTLMFDTTTKVQHAHQIVREKIITIDPDKEYGFFLTSADDERSGIWLEGDRTLEYYMLRDGDSLFYLIKIRNLRLRMLDGSVKTLQVDESKSIQDIMVHICDRIGIPNNEEYGLCREESEPKEESKFSTGTLTLKKKTIQREKDAKLEQLSKKLKTDDNVEWLDQHKTLRESQVDPKETLLFKRRLFYSDRNVDSRDPVQLNLLYVQTRDAILDCRHVVTEDKAAEFAGIQCQVQYGDFQEDKHKPGFIENLKEFLPEQYESSWGIEKKIIKEHRKHQGLSQIEAKHMYTKTARELPTYGVTFFLVKEKQKTKKKLVPRLLGINSESILRLDEETKEILQVWPLTQVKSYRAGSESFTLNFGDYSEKEYAVKTNEAFRIRDILQGYIDIIRKRLAAPYNVTHTEGEVICEEMVESSRGTLTQNVVASKVQTHSLIGPSQIISVDQGQQSQMGTKIVTVHEVITSRQGDRSQQALRGELKRSNSKVHDFDKKLNRLNSESVRTVVLLSDPTKENIAEVRNIVNGFKENLPGILKGANETAANLKGDQSKKLLEELDELCAYINTLVSTTMKSDLSDPDNLMTAQDSARKIADLSTQMFFSLDPKSKRRSQLLRRSRNSFILDEKTEASLRRASFITAADNACQAVEHAKVELDEEYNGPPLTDEEQKRLEVKTVDKMGKLNAAIALLLNAHADPKNIDYEMAVNSMKTIHELVPDFVKDSKSLLSVGNESGNKKLRDQIIQLLDGARNMCMLTGSNDVNKMHDVGNNYADVSKKLIFTFKRPDHTPDANGTLDLENQIMAIAKEVGEKVSLLLMEADELNNLESNDPHSENLDAAGVKCADATQGLLACAKLTAPTIHEPHCQSALTAAAENLSSSAQNLALTYKPLVDKPGRHGFAKQLADRVFDLAKALDKLKGAYANLNVKNNDVPDAEESDLQQNQRLQFVVTSSAAKNGLEDADKELNEMIKMLTEPSDTTKTKNPDARRLLSEKMAQLNAAIASLLQATSDVRRPDYDTAGTAINTICHLTPNIINETKALHGNIDDNSWPEITENLKDMLEAIRGLCGSAEDCNIEELNEAASKIANSSGKLTFIFNPRRNAKKEGDVLQLSRSAVDQTSHLLANVDQLAKRVGGDEGTTLDTAGVQLVDAAQQLLKTAEITAPSIQDARCQAVLLSAIERLSDRARTMEQSWKPLIQAPTYHKSGELLNHGLKELNKALDKLRKACQVANEKDEGDVTEDESRDNEDKARIHFTRTLKAAKSAMVDSAQEIKNADVPLNKMHENDIKKNNILATNNLISQKLAKLNAAIATLLQATSDRERPDYDEAIRAINTISSLTPDIIKDVKPLQSSVDDKSWKNITDNLKSIVDTTSEICDNVDNPLELKQSASKFANSVSKLSYVFNPRNNQRKENQILDLSRDAVEQMSLLLSNVYQLAEGVDGDDGEKLDKAGVSVVDSAQMLLKIAEITSPNISDEHCQAALLSSVDQVSKLAEDLKKTWKPLVQTPKHRPIGDQLDQNLNIVQNTLDKLRAVCQETEDLEESKPYQLSDLTEAKNKIKEAEKLFSEDKLYEQRALQTGNKNIATADKPVLEKRLQLSQKLAQLNEAVALLLQAMLDRENPDYENAKQTINIISNLTPDIVQETLSLQGNMDDNSREILFKEAKGLCSASQEICSSVEHNNLEELNQAATKYAQSSGTIHFIVSPRSYPNKEKKILDLSRSACERTSLMLSRVSRLAESIGGDEGENLDISGARVADSAQTLLSTAQVTSPSISDSDCQSALVSSADTLSDLAQDLAKIWKPLIQNPKTKQIGEQLTRDLDLLRNELDVLKETCQDNTDFNEALEIPQQQTMYDHKNKTVPKTENNMKNIDMLLEDIYKHTKGENKQNPIVIEDTPLRQLASKIMESAKTKSECIKYSANERKRFADIANKLAEAINKLDIANAKCRDTPFSSREKKERALQLENAILNLQLICIQSRQKDGELSNIVDLTEFVDDVTSAVDDLHNTTKGIKQEHEKEAIKEINNKCQKIREHASKLMNPQNSNTEGNMFDDVLQIDQFAKDCDDQVQAINEALPKIDDENTRQNVKSKLNIIEEKCNLLSFAAKSSISNAESATLEESLRNLEDVEKKIEVIVEAYEGFSKLDNQNVARNNKQSIQAAQSALATVIAAGNENKLPKALARYATQMKSLNQTNERNSKLKEHLDRLLDALKMQITEKNRRVVTWQDINDGEVSEITEKILKELESYAQEESGKHVDEDTPNAVNEKLNIVNDSDIKSLLAPNTETVPGDERELRNKLNQQIQKLNSMTGTIMLSLGKPESLARSLHITSEAASHLSSIARGLKNQDPVQNKRIEEAAQEMSIATYKLLKTSESVCHTPKHPESRRRLLEACSLLNDSLNNLARAAAPADKMQRDCSELARSLQLQQSFLTSENPSCALSYTDCFDAIQNQQDVISKI